LFRTINKDEKDLCVNKKKGKKKENQNNKTRGILRKYCAKKKGEIGK